MKSSSTSRAILFYGIAVVSLGLLQVSIPDRTAGFLAKPDFLLVLAILAGFLHGPMEGAVVGLATGFFRDSFAGGTVGVGMLVGLYAGLLSGLLFQRLFRKGFFAAMLQVLIVATVTTLAVEGAGILFDAAGSFTPNEWVRAYLARTFLVQLALDVAAAVPLFFLMRYAGPRKRGSGRVTAQEAASETWR
jgi:rod shape-determining protein MreD